MSKFVVLNPQGEVLKSNASAKEAAELVLGYDGHEWEIRLDEDGEGYTLWVSKFSRNSTTWSGLHETSLYSFDDNIAEAEAHIFKQVCNLSSCWNGCTIIGQDQYDASMAENEED